MKKYMKPTLTITELEAACSLCAGSSKISGTPPRVTTTGEIGTGDAATAYSKKYGGYVTHYSAWEAWDDK